MAEADASNSGRRFVIVRSPFDEADNWRVESLAEVDGLLADIAGDDALWMALYPEPGVVGFLAVNVCLDRAGITHITGRTTDQCWSVCDPAQGDREVMLPCDNGQMDECQAQFTGSRAEAFRAVRYFYTDQGRDPDLCWVRQSELRS